MSVYRWLVLISLILSFATTVYTLLRRNAPKAQYFALISLSTSIYLAGYWLEITAPNFDAAYYGVIVSYLGGPYIAPWVILFILDRHNTPIKWWHGLLFVYPAVVSILVATWPMNGLFYKDPVFVVEPAMSYLRVSTTIFHTLSILYLFGLMFVGFCMMLWYARKSEPAVRKREYVIMAALTFPFIALLLYVLPFSPISNDVTPIGLMATVLLVFYAVFRFNLLDMLPLAKDQMLEGMKDPYLVVDIQWCFLDANLQAKALFPALDKAAFGTDLLKASPDIMSIKTALENDSELIVERGGATHCYRPSMTRVMKKGRDVCSCILLYETTDTWRLMNELKQMASYDNLTGVYNRASYNQLANLAFNNVRSNGLSLAVMMFDLDFFKKINDSYGHPFGDQVLREVAQRIKNRLRQGDVFARYGGEEFCACLPNLNRDSARRVAEGLRSIVEDMPVRYQDIEASITVSIGVCVLDGDSYGSIGEMMEAADKALYQAKAKGRNRVWLLD